MVSAYISFIPARFKLGIEQLLVSSSNNISLIVSSVHSTASHPKERCPEARQTHPTTHAYWQENRLL